MQIAGLLRISLGSSLLFTILSSELFQLTTMGHIFPTIRLLFPPFATSGLLLVTSQFLFDPFGLLMSLCVNYSKVFG